MFHRTGVPRAVETFDTEGPVRTPYDLRPYETQPSWVVIDESSQTYATSCLAKSDSANTDVGCLTP